MRPKFRSGFLNSEGPNAKLQLIPMVAQLYPVFQGFGLFLDTEKGHSKNFLGI